MVRKPHTPRQRTDGVANPTFLGLKLSRENGIIMKVGIVNDF